MESEERREANLSQRRDCDRECCDIENRGKCNFLSGIELGMPLNLLLRDRESCSGEESK